MTALASTFGPAQDVKIYAGSDFAIEIVIADEDGQPHDLTGRSFALIVFDAATEMAVAQRSAVADGASCSLALLGDETRALREEKGARVYRLQIMEVGLTGTDIITDGILTVLPSPLTINPTISASSDAPVVQIVRTGDRRQVVFRYQGAPGLSASAQMFGAGLIDAPTPDEMAAYLRAPAVIAAADATAAANDARETTAVAADAIEDMEAARQATVQATSAATAATAEADTAREAAETATAETRVATQAAVEATTETISATADAVVKTALTVTATANAEEKAAAADTARAAAQTATVAAQAATTNANAGADNANLRAGQAQTATGNADAATGRTNAAIEQANALGVLAATQVQTAGPTLLIKPGAGTWPSEVDAAFPGRQSLYTRFEGLSRTKTTFAAVTDFARPTIATFMDAAGTMQTAAAGSARLGYRLSGSAWVLAGLLLEAQGSNLWLQSQDLTANNWNKLNTVPSAMALLENGANAGHNVTQIFDVPAGASSITISCEASERAGSAKRYLGLVVPNSSAVSGTSHATFDLSSGTVTNTALVAGAVARMTLVGLGKWLCQLTVPTIAAAAVNPQIRLSNTPSTAISTYAGDGASGLNVSEMQAEIGSIATSRIRTTTAQVTRAADVTTKALGAEHNPNAGSILAKVFRPFAPPAASVARIVQLDDGTEANRLTIRASGGKIVLEAVVGGSVTGTAIGSDWLAATSYAIVASYDRATGALVLAVNGTEYAATATALPASLTTRRLGCDSAGGNQLNGFLMPYLEHSANGLLSGSYFPRVLTAVERSAFA